MEHATTNRRTCWHRRTGLSPGAAGRETGAAGRGLESGQTKSELRAGITNAGRFISTILVI